MRNFLFLILLVVAGLTGVFAGDCADPAAITAYEEGTALMLSGNTDAAIAKYEQAISIDAGFGEAYESLEQLYRNSGRYDDAIRAAEHLLLLQPWKADYYEYVIKMDRSLAATPKSAHEALERSGKYPPGSDNAIAACQEAIRIHPVFLDAHVALVQHYIHAGDENATKDEIAALISLLVSDKGGFINGQLLQVNGATQT